MRRGDFEDLVRRHLDEALLPRGFALTPQPPADFDDDEPHAVYEAWSDDFNRRYPALAVFGDPGCIDIWVLLDPRTGRISSRLNGPPLEEVMARLGLSRRPTPGPPGTAIALQLTDLAARLAELLDRAKRHLLPERLRAKVQSFPEINMGAQRIALVLATGAVLDDVIVAWGDEIVSIGGEEPRGLPLHDVVDVVDRSSAGRGF
jgi:hypothetical protein